MRRSASQGTLQSGGEVVSPALEQKRHVPVKGHRAVGPVNFLLHYNMPSVNIRKGNLAQILVSRLEARSLQVGARGYFLI